MQNQILVSFENNHTKIVILYKKNIYVCFSGDIPMDSSENNTNITKTKDPTTLHRSHPNKELIGKGKSGDTGGMKTDPTINSMIAPRFGVIGLLSVRVT